MYIHADTLRRAWCNKSEKRRPPVAHVSHHSAAPLRTARLHAHSSACAPPQAARSPSSCPPPSAKTAPRSPVSRQHIARFFVKAHRVHRAHVLLRTPAPPPSPPHEAAWHACKACGLTSAPTCTTALVQTAPGTLPQHTSEKCRSPRKSNHLAAALAGTRSAAQSEGMDRMSPRSSDTACRAYLSWKVSCQHRLTAIRQGGLSMMSRWV